MSSHRSQTYGPDGHEIGSQLSRPSHRSQTYGPGGHEVGSQLSRPSWLPSDHASQGVKESPDPAGEVEKQQLELLTPFGPRGRWSRSPFFRRRIEPLGYTYVRGVFALVGVAILVASLVYGLLKVFHAPFSTTLRQAPWNQLDQGRFGRAPVPSILTNIFVKNLTAAGVWMNSTSLGYVEVLCHDSRMALDGNAGLWNETCKPWWYGPSNATSNYWALAFECSLCASTSPDQGLRDNAHALQVTAAFLPPNLLFNSTPAAAGFGPAWQSDVQKSLSLLPFDATNQYLNFRIYLPYEFYSGQTYWSSAANVTQVTNVPLTYSQHQAIKNSGIAWLLGFTPRHITVGNYAFGRETDITDLAGLSAAAGMLTVAFAPPFLYDGLNSLNAYEIRVDQRSETVFQALGTTGGLFNIIGGVFLILFGGSMLFPLLGVQTFISPFGMLGKYSRGLREHLHALYPAGAVRSDPAGPTEYIEDWVVSTEMLHDAERGRHPFAQAVYYVSDKLHACVGHGRAHATDGAK